METSDPRLSPILQEVRFDPGADPAGADQGNNGRRRPGSAPSLFLPSPARGPVTAEFDPGAPGAPLFQVFDVRGRLLWTTPLPPGGAGLRRLVLPAFPSGVYLCRLSVRGRSVDRRLVEVR
jgi:hypothetical protein